MTVAVPVAAVKSMLPETVCAARAGVVIPVFNRAEEVIRALDSVAAQDHPPHAVIVVDDGSTDETAAAVTRWCAKPRPFAARLLRQPNSGVSVARNAGWDEIRDFDFIAFLDSDDVWPADFLGKARRALLDHPDAVAAVSDRLMIYEGEDREVREDMRSLPEEPIVWLYRHGAGVLSGTLIRSQIAARIGNFDPVLLTGQDAAFLLRLSLQGRWVHVDSNPVGYFRDFTMARSGAGNLSRIYADGTARWARIYDRFYRQARRAVPRRTAYIMRKELVRRWRMAARSHRRRRRYRRAFKYYLYALRRYLKNAAIRPFANWPE